MSYINAEQTRYERYVFYFQPQAFEELQAPALMRFGDYAGGYAYILTSKRKAQLLSLLTQLDEALARGDEASAALSRGLVLQLLYLFGEPDGHAAGPTLQLPARAREVQEYLDEHFREIRSVTEVADHFFYSREYLCRMFRAGMNTTVSEYLLKRRVSCAQQMMTTDLTLTEICFRSGFGSVSAFIRAFEQIMGMSPSRYRQTLNKAKGDHS